jgi:hypothetical protein
VTDLEYNNLLSTKNLYDLPTYYNYGVGSAGFNVFRELAAHIKTTNWVLEGATENFPLMYHYRVMPFTGVPTPVDAERHDGYVRYWGGDTNIGRYMLDRTNARHELVLFLEHLPHVLQPWLLENPGKVRQVLDDLFATITVLRQNEIIHFDAHFHNILTDGERTYLTDFGLVLDRSFALTKEEEAFFDARTHYDYGEVLSCLDAYVARAYEALPEQDKHRMRKRYGIREDLQGHERTRVLLDNIERIHAEGVMNLDESYVACLFRYRPIITLMQAFFSELAGNERKDTAFPHAELKRLLHETGVLADT